MKNLAQTVQWLIDHDKEHAGNVRQISIKSGVPEATILRLRKDETRDPRDSTIKPLADYFDVSLNQLKGLDPLEGDKNLQETRAPYEVVSNDDPLNFELDERVLTFAFNKIKESLPDFFERTPNNQAELFRVFYEASKKTIK